MEKSAFFADFWPSLRDAYDQLLRAVNAQGKTKAKQNFNDLRQRWEGYHFREYMKFCLSDGDRYSTTSEKYISNKDKFGKALKSAGCDRGVEDLQKTPSGKTIGEEKLQSYLRAFALYHEFDHLPIPRAIIYFLDFCLNHNGGVLSAYYPTPENETGQARLKAEAEAKKQLKTIVADFHKYLASYDSDEDWLSASNHNAIPFTGRESELAELNAFAKGHPERGTFQVWAIVGASGAGKTRLLNHWSAFSLQDEWHHIRISPDTKIHWDDWQPAKRTLISIDYILGYEEVIADIIGRAKDTPFEHNVRLLLLDHATPATMEGLLRDPRWGFDSRGADSFTSHEKGFFFKEAPLKLMAPDPEEEQEASAEYNRFLANIICAVAYRGEGNPTKHLDRSEVQQGLKYLEETTGARQALFAALVGYCIRQNRENPDNPNDYFVLSRRQLIEQYLKGSNRLIWKSEDEDDTCMWAAAFVAAANAIRGADFKTLARAVSREAGNALHHYKRFTSLCNRVVSGDNSIKLKPYEPDVLGETFFLMFLEDAPPVFEEYVCRLLTAGTGQAREQQAVEFVAFMTRLARNLSNDNHNDEHIVAWWQRLTDLLEAPYLSEQTHFNWAVSFACFEIHQVLKEKQGSELSSTFWGLIEQDALYQPPIKTVQAYHVRQAIKYSDLQKNTQAQPVPKKLTQLLSAWDSESSQNYTELMLALWEKNTAIADYLLQQRTDAYLSKASVNGWTALMFACRYDQRDVALALVKKEAALKEQDNEGMTALMLACRYDQPEVALALIEKGVEINTSNKIGQTPLMFAVVANQQNVVQALFRQGVDIDASMKLNDIEVTALGLARDAGFQEIIEMLEAKGALELPPLSDT